MLGNRKRVILATHGAACGDVFPFIAIAHQLKMRDISVVIAATPMFRELIESEGIEFHGVRPDFSDVLRVLNMNEEQFIRVGSQKPDFILHEFYLRHLRESYEDMLAIADNADLIATYVLAFAARIVAEERNVPHLGIVVSPVVLPSAYERSIWSALPTLSPVVYRFGPTVASFVLGLAKRSRRKLSRPIDVFRKEVGLPVSKIDPLIEGLYFSGGAVGLYSEVMGKAQPDHPKPTSIVGFPYFDGYKNSETRLDDKLERFVAAGPMPLVFTLGSSGVTQSTCFVTAGLAAARHLKQRAIFLISGQQERWSHLASNDVMFDGYVQYSLIFPRARAIIHHGGIGTIALALKAGRPQLVFPHIADQPDNAARIVRLGVARSISFSRLSPRRMTKELSELLSQDKYSQRAAEIAKIVEKDDGSAKVADVILKILRN